MRSSPSPSPSPCFPLSVPVAVAGNPSGGGGHLLEDAAATRQTSGQTDVFVSMFVCSSDARS